MAMPNASTGTSAPAVIRSSSRERHQSNRSDHSSSPATIRTVASFSVANQASSSSQSATVEGFLAAHAHVSDSTLAALEAAVAERNNLSTQNAQLWKLIEKQRSGYGQLMKELERVRGERDAYRSRLQEVGENTDTLLRAYREKDKRDGKGGLRSTASHTHLRSSESSTSNAPEPRTHMVRTNSDDSAARGQHLHHSHSQDHVSRSQPTLREQYSSQTTLNIPASNSRSSSLAPSPLSAQPLSSSDSVTSSPQDGIAEGHSASTITTSPTRETFSVSVRPSLDLPPPSSATTQRTVPLNAEPGDPVLGHWQPGPRPSLEAIRPIIQTTMAPHTPSQNVLPRDESPARTPRLQPQIPLSLQPRQPSPEKPSSSSNSLSPLVNGDSARGPFALSRESRISLPEEAKRYYANLGDSPISSPSISANGFPYVSGQNSPVKNQMSQIIEATESMRSQSGTPSAASTNDGRSGGKSTGDEGAPFLDMEDGDSVYSSRDGRRKSGVDDTDDGMDNGVDDIEMRRSHDGSKGAAVEDFPLPPSTIGYATAPGQSQLSALPPQPSTPVSPFPLVSGEPHMTFRALPLLASDLPSTDIHVVNSTIRPNDRGKEVLSFVISVSPGRGKDPWKVEKMYSDVLGLDARVRARVGKSVIKKMVTLPEGRMWRDHAPAKVDQRKNALEQYLRSLIALPVKNKDEIIAFFTSDIVRETQKPVSQAGYKEGYLTKRGKNFGGWKSRYFVLQGPSLEYYESVSRTFLCLSMSSPVHRGGAHLGSITITGAQIGRQQRAPDRRESDEDNEYRHAFLIIEAKRGPGGSSSRHVLCADSDQERDNWVEELVRYVTGTYSEDQVAVIQQNGMHTVVSSSNTSQSSAAQPRSSSSSSSNQPVDVLSTPVRRTRDTVKPATTPAKITTDVSNGKLYPVTSQDDVVGPGSVAPSPIDYISLEGPISNSLPTASPLGAEDVDVLNSVSQRANSELGHYPDLVDPRAAFGKAVVHSPDQPRKKVRRMSVNPLKATIPERTPSPEKDAAASTPRVDAHGKVKISAPMNGTPIPAGYKFGGKDAPSEASTASSDRREKAKSRTFWGFGRHDKPNTPAMIPRAVFGVSLDESLDVAQIASLPAIVFRCIQYLEIKKAEQEEGIYRLSGSSAVIKSLKDRFNTEGDVDLLSSDEYWDPHAIAGLLKTFLRELPASILTRDLHLRFLSVIDFVDPQERIRELSHLIASLPIANYSLLRALTAHLILIVQNANVNKMTMRNVGIVFSPTLGIPAGVFSLMLGEFKRVFNVDGTLEEGETSAADDEEEQEGGASIDRRNSRRYTDAAADQLLGLSGRTLPAAEDGPSDDGEEASVIEGSTEDDVTENESDVVGSSAASSSAHLLPGVSHGEGLQSPEAEGGLSPTAATSRSRAAQHAATRGLSVAVTDKESHRRSGIVGLPVSPRPSPRMGVNGAPSPVVSSPLATPK
ncbi:uncharacterized protein FIBRA_04650 [Fibroporia radiculosa]|uniref:RhoGAP-domain-containing protein n=1 Tax=Fibroporia radiculosa TaxID=599839 RepID=J4HWN0_9APHY|nr:uncharacterized protein FIBRA_04650 [Fibroporia radiculosa]CCM02547.1 predicted protein [Fibroporia radiculosa]